EGGAWRRASSFPPRSMAACRDSQRAAQSEYKPSMAPQADFDTRTVPVVFRASSVVAGFFRGLLAAPVVALLCGGIVWVAAGVTAWIWRMVGLGPLPPLQPWIIGGAILGLLVTPFAGAKSARDVGRATCPG